MTRTRIIATAAILCLWAAVPACEALTSEPGQRAAFAVLSSVAKAAANKLARAGIDVSKAPGCVSLDGLLPDADPAELCLVPGDLETATLQFPAVNEVAIRRLAKRGLRADTYAASCQTVEGSAVPLTACVYPGVVP